MNFIGIVGTNASFSYNRKLLWFMKKHFSEKATIKIQEIADLPLFCEDVKEVPQAVREVAQAISRSDGVIFATPEYDHSITAGLKSLLEWLSWGELHPLTKLPVMIVGVSLGNMGTVFAQENLRQILVSPGLEAFVLPSNQFLLGHAAEAFDEENSLKDVHTLGWLEHCFNNFIDYSKLMRPLRSLTADWTGEDSAADAKVIEKGEGWQIQRVKLGFPSDSLSKQVTTNAKDPLLSLDFLKAPESAEVLESSDGWWVEKTDPLKVEIDDNDNAEIVESVPVMAAPPVADTTTGASTSI